jgi:hypothetical protein
MTEDRFDPARPRHPAGHRAWRRRPVALVGATLGVGLLLVGAAAAGASGSTTGHPLPPPGSDHRGGGAVLSGSNGFTSGPFAQTVSGLPAFSWGSLFAPFLQQLAGPAAVTPSPTAQNVLPRSGWVSNLHVRNVTPASQSPDLAGPARFTVFDNSTGTAVACTIPTGASSCTSRAHAWFSAGDLISIQLAVLSPQAIVLAGASWSVTFG